MSVFSRSAALTAFVVVFAASVASAATVTVTNQGRNAFLDSAGRNGWYETTKYTLNGTARTASAGVFRLKATTAGGAVTAFLGFCLEPLDYLRLPKAYDEGTPLSYLAVSRLGSLVTNALSLVKDARTAAAFQLAAWEIANEGRGKLDLQSGAFLLTAAQKKTAGLSQSWLDLIGNGGWKLNAQVMILQAAGTQDLVTDLPPAPVPVPAAGFVLVSGLMGLVGLRRRRQV